MNLVFTLEWKRWTFQMSKQVFLFTKLNLCKVYLVSWVKNVEKTIKKSIWQKSSIQKVVINKYKIIKMRFKCHIKSFVMEMSIFFVFLVGCMGTLKSQQMKVYLIQVPLIGKCLRKH